MDTFETIRKRRSVREYTGETVPSNDLLKIVDAARLAASGSNNQPWEFVIITEPEMIRQLATAPWVARAGALVAVVMDPSSRWWLEDAAAAVENMLLAATALGYGSCWLEGQTLRREEEYKEMLGIPDDRRLITLVAFGVPMAWPTKEKKSLDEIVRWERYG
jgi:nitroreductase